MGAKEKLFRQKLANQIEKLLTQSEAVFGNEKLTHEWVEEMLQESQELIARLTIFKFLHELPEDADLEIEFLEMSESEEEEDSKASIPKYGDEILKEIDEFESSEAIDVDLTPDPIIEEEKVSPPVAEEKVTRTPDAEITAESEENTEAEMVTQIEEEVVIETVTETVTETIIVQEQTTEVESTPEQKPVTESTPEVVSETENPFEDTNVTKSEASVAEEVAREINDMVARTEPSLADKLSTKSIKKLAESIALNERFLYSNELFNGNMEAFKRALNELDHIASLDDAKRYLEVQLKEEYHWSMDSEAVKNFIVLVERRFV